MPARVVFFYNWRMSEMVNESTKHGSALRVGDALTLTIPPELVRDFKAVSGRRDVRRTMLEALEDWADAREAERVAKRIRTGTEKTVSLEQVKRELGL